VEETLLIVAADLGSVIEIIDKDDSVLHTPFA